MTSKVVWRYIKPKVMFPKARHIPPIWDHRFLLTASTSAFQPKQFKNFVVHVEKEMSYRIKAALDGNQEEAAQTDVSVTEEVYIFSDRYDRKIIR